MKITDQPAFSCITAAGIGGAEYSGLTKRELLAGMAMQGICVNAGSQLFRC